LRKLCGVVALFCLSCVALFGLAACGGGDGDGDGGNQGGTLKGTYASFPDYLDPALSYTMEGWTAMYNTYIPLLTYAHKSGVAGSEVVPGLAEDLPEISADGKTYTLQLRDGLEYSDGTPVVASDFPYSVERVLRLNSSGGFIFEGIEGAEEFIEKKADSISGIEADDKTGEITIKLTQPRGTFTNELGMLFAAVVPKGTPIKNQTSDPPPATGPYEIVETNVGRSWKYERNPAWAKSNSAAMPDLPGGHMDEIEIDVVRNGSTQVNYLENGKYDWMQNLPPADQYGRLKREFEGTQLRVEETNSTYFFWMNTTAAPFDDLKVREAVNYAIDGEALERVYAGQLNAGHQILPPGMPGYEEFDLFPHDLEKAEELIAEADPADRAVTVWTDDESPNKEAGEYLNDVLGQLGFDTTLKVISADNYFTLIANLSTPDLDIGWANWFQDYPNPNTFFQPLFAGESIAPTFNTNFSQIDIPALNKKIVELSEEQLGPEQEEAYAELDRRYMEEAPWAPYGNLAVSTFVSSAVDLDSVIFNPTYGQDLTSFQFK
jgi:peptide/nickel transport system substrate-binding protein